MFEQVYAHLKLWTCHSHVTSQTNKKRDAHYLDLSLYTDMHMSYLMVKTSIDIIKNFAV